MYEMENMAIDVDDTDDKLNFNTPADHDPKRAFIKLVVNTESSEVAPQKDQLENEE